MSQFQKPKDPTKVKKVKKEKKTLATPDKDKKPTARKLKVARLVHIPVLGAMNFACKNYKVHNILCNGLLQPPP